jgi:hypothetical protein
MWPKFAQKWANPHSRISTPKIGQNSAKKTVEFLLFWAKFNHYGGILTIFMGEYSTVRIRPKWPKFLNTVCITAKNTILKYDLFLFRDFYFPHMKYRKVLVSLPKNQIFLFVFFFTFYDILYLKNRTHLGGA